MSKVNNENTIKQYGQESFVDKLLNLEQLQSD